MPTSSVHVSKQTCATYSLFCLSASYNYASLVNSRSYQLLLNSLFFVSWSMDFSLKTFSDLLHNYFQADCLFISEYFIKLSILHNHDTRGRNFNFHVPTVKAVGSASFCHNAIKIWNELPNDIKNNSQKSKFKKETKSHLLSQMIV